MNNRKTELPKEIRDLKLFCLLIGSLSGIVAAATFLGFIFMLLHSYDHGLPVTGDCFKVLGVSFLCLLLFIVFFSIGAPAEWSAPDVQNDNDIQKPL